MLTPKAKAQYVEDGGMNCPQCQSDHLDTGEFEAGSGGGVQRVTCNACKYEWQDQYDLVGIRD